MKLLSALFLSASVLATASKAAEGNLHVVTTIKPLYSLVEMVLQGRAEHSLLVTGASSPHRFSLKPSQIDALSQADRIFMIGETLEGFMKKTLDSLGKRDATVEMMDVNGIHLLKSREKAIWKGDDDDHDHHDHHEHHGHHHHGLYDPHLWLSTGNAQVMLDAIAASLAQADPARAEEFKNNAESAKKRIRKLDVRLTKKLKSVQDKGFAVQHDAYQYFETRYGLRNLGSVAVDPERQPGAKHLKELRHVLKEEGAVCLFTEPQFEPAQARSLANDLNIRTAVLDPIGADIAPNAQAYPVLLNLLADNLASCLSD